VHAPPPCLLAITGCLHKNFSDVLGLTHPLGSANPVTEGVMRVAWGCQVVCRGPA
jgi:hypothetical protein